MRVGEMEGYRVKFSGSQADRAAALQFATVPLFVSAPEKEVQGKEGSKGAAAGQKSPAIVKKLPSVVSRLDIRNRLVCVLCNLKPAAMRGIKSQAVVLAASTADHTEVELVTTPHPLKVLPFVKGSHLQALLVNPTMFLTPRKRYGRACNPTFIPEVIWLPSTRMIRSPRLQAFVKFRQLPMVGSSSCFSVPS